MKRLFRLLLTVWAVTFCAVLAVSVLWPRNSPPPPPADAIVCLGGGMSYAGWERPGPASARRALTCAELYREGVAPVVLFSGHGHDILSAAEAMARLAAGHGVPPEAMIVEPEARSTIQNAAFALALLPDDTERIVIVTDAFHIPRSWLTFRALGAPETAAYAARMAYTTEDLPGPPTRFEWILRESVVIWVNAGRAVAYLAGGVLGIDEETRIGWFN